MRRAAPSPRAILVAFTAALAFGLPGAGVPPAAAQEAMHQKDVEEGLTCQCGCGLTVGACNHLECGFAIPVRKDIAESLARGETGEQILERYKQEYGEKVLSSPVPEGFNLLAWIGPYVAILVAGVVMFTFFRRRAGSGDDEPPGDGPTAGPAAGDERLEALRREVKDLEQ